MLDLFRHLRTHTPGDPCDALHPTHKAKHVPAR